MDGIHSRDFKNSVRVRRIMSQRETVLSVGDEGWSVELLKTWNVCPIVTFIHFFVVTTFVGSGSLSSSRERTILFVSIVSD
jgi:hypothetical protein